MRKFLQSKSGNATLLAAGFVFVLLLIFFLVAEMGATYEKYDYCVDVLQRACNGAVEKNIDDRYRADKVLKLNTTQAQQDVRRFVMLDFPDGYKVRISSIKCTATPPSMTVTGKITFNTLFSQYRWDDLTFTFRVRSTNYDLE